MVRHTHTQIDINFDKITTSKFVGFDHYAICTRVNTINVIIGQHDTTRRDAVSWCTPSNISTSLAWFSIDLKYVLIRLCPTRWNLTHHSLTMVVDVLECICNDLMLIHAIVVFPNFHINKSCVFRTKHKSRCKRCTICMTKAAAWNIFWVVIRFYELNERVLVLSIVFVRPTFDGDTCLAAISQQNANGINVLPTQEINAIGAHFSIRRTPSLFIFSKQCTNIGYSSLPGVQFNFNGTQLKSHRSKGTEGMPKQKKNIENAISFNWMQNEMLKCCVTICQRI